MRWLVHSVVVSCRKYTNKARKGSLRLGGVPSHPVFLSIAKKAGAQIPP